MNYTPFETQAAHEQQQRIAAIHEPILAHLFEGKEPAAPGQKPIAIIMAGGGGAGKSAILTDLTDKGQLPNHDFVTINPDDIKDMLPEYAALKKSVPQQAAALVHEESSIIAAEAVGRATQGHYNLATKEECVARSLILDKTMSDKEKGAKLIQDLQSKGYEVHLIGVTIKPELAYDRAEQRAKSSGRHVPLPVLKAAHKGFNDSYEALAKLADKAMLYDNSQTKKGEHTKIAEKLSANEPLKIVDHEKFELFQKRKSPSVTLDPRNMLKEAGLTIKPIASLTLEKNTSNQRQKAHAL